MKPEVIGVLGVLAMFIVLEIIFTRFFNKPGAKRSDAIVEILSSGFLLLLTQPTILLTAGLGMALFFPGD
jgi:hypothetical protein